MLVPFGVYHWATVYLKLVPSEKGTVTCSVPLPYDVVPTVVTFLPKLSFKAPIKTSDALAVFSFCRTTILSILT